MSHSDECYNAIRECVARMAEVEPRCRIACNEEDATTEPQHEAHEFLKVDGNRVGRDFKVYGLMANVSGFVGAGIVDFAEVLMSVKSHLPSAFDAVKDIVVSWDRFFDKEMQSDWRAMWND